MTTGERAAPRRRVRHHDDVLVSRTALRLALLVGLSAAALVAALTTVAMVVLSWTQEDARQALVSDIIRIEDSDDLLPGSWMWMRGPNGIEHTIDMPAEFPVADVLRTVESTGVPDSRRVRVADREFMVRTENYNGELKQVILDLAADRLRRARVVHALLFSGGVGLLLAALGGAWLGRRAVRPMADSLALQRRFVADASHELRTPVTLLSTRAQMVRRSLRETGGGAAELDALIEDTNQLTAILEDLLLAADHRSETSQVAVDVLDICRQAVASAAPEAATHGITLVPVQGVSAQVTGSPVALRRVATALIDNAVRHARSEVRVTVTTAGRRLYVDVSDDGGGIDPEVMPHLFDRFASGSNGHATSGDRRHYGLGLALVSEVAARHGGSVTSTGPVASDVAEGAGATLRLTLPLRTGARRTHAE